MKIIDFFHKKGFSFSIFTDSITTSRHNNNSADKSVTVSTWHNTHIIQTTCGLLKGKKDKQGTWCWKGIPYGQPPVGLLRWKAPLDPLPWKGIRKAKKFSKSAAQVLPVIGYYGSEDCLYLNVWRKRTLDHHLPVYVFIHGGGNSIGSGTIRDFHGYRVAAHSNIVYVSLNYRLGVLGWFRHPAVTNAGSPEDQSGNFGTLDIIKALEWIKNNISAFGGNPGNVTIAGESGGGMNVLSLLISKKAKGLFHKAVVESGLAITWPAATAESQSRELLINLIKNKKKIYDKEDVDTLIGAMTGEDINRLFYSASPKEMMKLIPKMFYGMARWITLFGDGCVLPEQGYKVFETGTWENKVPLIVGVTKDETKLFGIINKDPPRGTKLYDVLWTYRSLIWHIYGLYNIGRWITSHKTAPPVYAYRFDWGSPDKNGVSVLPGKLGSYLGAAHYMEIPFFLGNGEPAISVTTGRLYTRKNREGRKKLTSLCMNYLAHFAWTGDPNDGKLPVWHPWNPEPGKEKILVLDAGHRDLRLSYLKDDITIRDVIEKIKSEHKEPELSSILELLNRHIPFGIIEDTRRPLML